MPPRSKTMWNMSAIPLQAESWPTTPRKPNQAEGAIGAEAEPQ